MKKQDKIFEVQNLSAKVKDAKAVALADYKGLNVAQATELRQKVAEAGGELQVTKNRLLLRALRENQYRVSEEELEGPTITLFANEDEITPLKTLVKFGKDTGLLPLKIGFMGGRVLGKEEISRFATLPSKEELQAKLVGMLASPPSRLVYALNYNIQKLALVLDQVRNKKAA
jgi:large subunit ribosomal protein L10